jgi:hypothetical protein
MSDDESEFDAYLSLADVTEDDHRWAFGTGFADPLAGLGEAGAEGPAVIVFCHVGQRQVGVELALVVAHKCGTSSGIC